MLYPCRRNRAVVSAPWPLYLPHHLWSRHSNFVRLCTANVTSMSLPSAMHMQLLNNDCIIIFNCTGFDFSSISLPSSYCQKDPFELVVNVDYATHSVEYDVAANSFRLLTI